MNVLKEYPYIVRNDGLQLQEKETQNRFFEDETAAAAAALPPVVEAASTTRTIDEGIFKSNNNAEDIANVHAEGFDVDNDNEPAPENVPTQHRY